MKEGEHTLVNRILEQMGIKTVNPKHPHILYTNTQTNIADTNDYDERSKRSVELVNQLFSKGETYEEKIKNATLPFDNPTFFPNPVNARNAYLSETQKALANVEDASFIFFDTETLGSLPQTRRGTKDIGRHVDFDVAQLSMGVARMDSRGELKRQGDILNLTNRINKETYSQMDSLISQLEKDPSKWVKMSPEQRRSLIDLSLYSDADFFSVVERKATDSTTMRLNVMTGQPEQKISIESSPQVVQNNLSNFRQGLENRNNPEFMNETAEVFNFFEQTTQSIYKEGREVILAGHNIQGFDEPGLRTLFNPYAKGTATERALSSPSADTLQMSRVIQSSNPDYTQLGHQLGQAYSHATAGVGDLAGAHNAAADVDMNIEVMNSLFKDAKAVKLKNGQSMHDVLFNQPASQINIGGKYIATNGFNPYQPNSFTQNQNQHSAVLRLDPETGTFVPSRSFQESSLVKGGVYSPLGQIDNYKINGVQHSALILQDHTNETISIVLDSNKSRLDNIFASGQLTPEDQLSPEVKSYYQKDRQRRRFESITDPKTRFKGESVIKRIESAYRDIDEFESAYEIEAARYGGKLTPGQEEIVARKVFDSKNKDLGTQYQKSWDKYMTNINNRGVLLEERNFAEELISEAKRAYPKDGQKVQANLFVSNSMDIYREEVVSRALGAGAITEDQLKIGHTGMKMHGVQLSVNGDMNYMDVSNPTVYESSIHRVLNNRGTRQTNGQTLQNFDSLSSNILSQLHPDDKVEMYSVVNELRKDVLNDIRRDGRVSQSTSQKISNRFYGLHESKKLKSTAFVPQKGIAARRQSAGVFLDAPFMNGLTEKKSEFFSGIFEQAKEQIKGHNISPNMSVAIDLSEEMSTSFQRTQDFVDKMGHFAHASQEIHDFDPGEVKKATAAIQKYDVKKGVQDVLVEYEKNNFDTALMFNEHTEQMELLFSFKGDNINLQAMSADQLSKNSKVGRQVLPFVQANGGIDTNAGTVINKMTMDIRRGTENPVRVGTSIPDMFKDIQNQAYYIEEKRKKELMFPTGKTHQDILQSGVSTMTAKSIEGKAFSAYSSGISPNSVDQVFSPTKTFNQSFTVSSDSIIEDYLANTKQYDNLYKDWRNYQANNKGASINTADDFWRSQKETGLMSVRFDALLNYNNSIGKQSGYQVDLAGINSTQFASGTVSLRDIRNSAPFGLQSSSVREQIIKAQNYDSISRSSIDGYWQDTLTERYSHLGERAGSVARKATNRRLANNPMLHMAYTDENIANSQVNARGSQMRTYFGTEREVGDIMTERKPGVLKGIKREIDEVTSRIQTATSPSEKIKLHAQLLELEKNRSELQNANLSIFDGQAIMRESMAKSMITNELKTLSVPESENLPAGILEYMANETGTEYLDGQFADLQEGITRFSTPMSYQEMQKRGLIDKVGKLNVGEVVSSSYMDDGSQTIDRFSSTSKRIGEEAQLLGITTDRRGRQALLMHDTRSIMDGDKILGLGGEFRSTVRLIQDDAMDALGFKNIDLIAENIAVDKNAYGVALNTIFTTSQDNIRENLEGINYEAFIGTPDMPASELPGLLPIVQEQLASSKYTVQDLMKEEIQDKVFSDSYKPLLEQMGLVTEGENSHVVYNNKTGIYDFNSIGHLDSLFGEEGQANYQAMYQTATEKYGFTSKNAVVDVGVHNVSHFVGQGTKGHYSFRERNLMEIKDKLVGRDISTYRDHM